MQRPADPTQFLSAEERLAVERAIAEAEQRTSGEIKLFINRFCWEPLREKAARVFRRLELDRTKERNAVLIYLVTANREFLVYGDDGINRKVPEDFWVALRDRMQTAFRQGDMGTGLVEAIDAIGRELAAHFPHRKDDVNELPDTVEFGSE